MFKKTLLLSGIALCLLGANDASAMRRSSVRHPMAAPKSTDHKEQAELRKQLEELHQKRFEESKAKVEAELAEKEASVPTPTKKIDSSARVHGGEEVNQATKAILEIIDTAAEGNDENKKKLYEMLLSTPELQQNTAELMKAIHDGNSDEMTRKIAFIGNTLAEKYDSTLINKFIEAVDEKINPEDDEKEGMSTSSKLLIGAGTLAALGYGAKLLFDRLSKK